MCLSGKCRPEESRLQCLKGEVNWSRLLITPQMQRGLGRVEQCVCFWYELLLRRHGYTTAGVVQDFPRGVQRNEWMPKTTETWYREFLYGSHQCRASMPIDLTQHATCEVRSRAYCPPYVYGAFVAEHDSIVTACTLFQYICQALVDLYDQCQEQSPRDKRVQS